MSTENKKYNSNANNEELDDEFTEKRIGNHDFTRRQWTALIFICLTYVCIIPNRAFVASIATTLKEEDLLTNSTFGLLGLLSGLAYAFGKAFNGTIIDGRFCFKFMNEIRALYLFQIVSCACVFLFSFGSDVTFFTLMAAPNAVVQAGTWPALAKLVSNIYEPAQFGRVFAFMGVASKIGSVVARVYIGNLLIAFDDWRWAVRAVSFLGVLGVCIFGYFATFQLRESDEVWFAFPYYSKLKEFFHIRTFDSFVSNLKDESNDDTIDDKRSKVANVTNKQLHCTNAKRQEELPEEQKQELQELKNQVLREISEDIDDESAYDKYTRLVVNRRFLLIAFSVMCLTVLVGVEAFSDLLIDDVLDVETNGYVTIVSACLPCGIVVALFASPFVVQKYQPTLQQQQKFVIWSLVGIVVLAIAMLAWIWIFYQTSHTSDGIALTIMGILLFLYGLILAYPYYIPPSVFSLRYGGRDGGTVNALLDLFGFAFVAPVSVAGAALSEIKNGWGWVWLTMYVPISIACIIFYAAFNKQNLKSEKRQELLMKRIEAEIDILTKGFAQHQATIEMESNRASGQTTPPDQQ